MTVKILVKINLLTMEKMRKKSRILYKLTIARESMVRRTVMTMTMKMRMMRMKNMTKMRNQNLNNLIKL